MCSQPNSGATCSSVSPNYSGYVYTYAASRITRLSMRTLRHYAQKGIIAAIRRGQRCWMFKVTDLHEFNERRAARRGFRRVEKNPLPALQCLQGISLRGIPSLGSVL